MIIGAQLFNVRDYCKNLDDLRETLKKISAIGYKAVQLSGVCDFTAEEILPMLKENGLVAPITHFKFERIVNDTENTIALHKDAEIKYVGLGSMPGFKDAGCSKDFIDSFAEQIAPAVKKIHDAGLKFMYHNHNMEFVKYGDITALEYLVSKFSPEEFGVTLDSYWVVAGGGETTEWMDKLHGRLNCIHLKDMVYSGIDKAVRMCPVGKGNINFKKICEKAIEEGVEYAFVEQDRAYEEDPFDCLKQSFDYLHSLGYC